ncbi:MAG: DnaJ domain-containing protein [Desulfovibrio sp.]|jgi:curved DNA-binding protein|nr:DnaJ domain-containing protein [Desulfovibrio sp.]
MSVEYKDYYKLLGVDRGSSAEDLAKAFKRLARQYHPDLHPGDKKSEEKFKEINEAYEVLKDPEKRRLYDKLGANWQHGQQFQGEPGFENVHFTFNGKSFDGSGGFSDFFETLFGGAAQGGDSGRGARFGPDPFGGFSARARRGRDVEAEMALCLEDVQRGGKRTFTLRMEKGPRTLEVNVPPGIREGAKLRLAGQGEPGTDGGTPGDLFLRVRYLPHPNFRTDGDDLLCDLRLTPWEAVLGAKISVPTLEGNVELTIPPGSSSGRKFRLRSRGLGSGAKRGDLLVRVMVIVPPALTDEERELWRKLAGVSSLNPRG